MKSKKISCLFAGFALLFSACSSEMLNEPMSDNMQPGEQTQTRLSFEQALSRGEKVYDELFKDEMRTRGSKRQVESVECIVGSTRTRGANEGDTLFYVVNYADMGGFLMVPTDSRLEPVYAMSDHGRLDFSDTVQNKGLKAFYDLSVAGAESVLSGIEGPYPGTPGTPESTPLQVGPLLSEAQQNIGQDYPYNEYTGYTNGQRNLVGCPAVAMEQIMSYYKYPYRPDNNIVDWDQINAGENVRKLALILSYIGQRIGTHYSPNGSGVSDPIYIRNGFEHYDYDPGREFELTSSRAASQLLKGPVLVYTELFNSKSGHVWVIDGYKRTSDYSYMGPTYYLHCIWGWNGFSNGYFTWNNTKFVSYPAEDKVFEPLTKVYMLWGLKPLYNFEQ